MWEIWGGIEGRFSERVIGVPWLVKDIDGTEKSESTAPNVLSQAIPSTTSVPCIGRRYRGTLKSWDWRRKGTSTDNPEQCINSPFPTITKNSGNGVTGNLRKDTTHDCMILWELPVSIRTDTAWPAIDPSSRRVFGAGPPYEAVMDS